LIKFTTSPQPYPEGGGELNRFYLFFPLCSLCPLWQLFFYVFLGAFAYRDVGKGREQERKLCVFAYRDVGKGREQERKLCASRFLVENYWSASSALSTRFKKTVMSDRPLAPPESARKQNQQGKYLQAPEHHGK
jgi:hypothetical protein